MFDTAGNERRVPCCCCRRRFHVCSAVVGTKHLELNLYLGICTVQYKRDKSLLDSFYSACSAPSAAEPKKHPSVLLLFDTGTPLPGRRRHRYPKCGEARVGRSPQVLQAQQLPELRATGDRPIPSSSARSASPSLDLPRPLPSSLRPRGPGTRGKF